MLFIRNLLIRCSDLLQDLNVREGVLGEPPLEGAAGPCTVFLEDRHNPEDVFSPASGCMVIAFRRMWPHIGMGMHASDKRQNSKGSETSSGLSCEAQARIATDPASEQNFGFAYTKDQSLRRTPQSGS